MASLCAIFVLVEGHLCWTWILFPNISEAFGILDFIFKCPGESLEVFEWAKVWYDSCWRKDNSGFFECFEKKVGSHNWKWALVLSRNKGAWTGLGLIEAGEMARFSTFKSIVSKHH